MTSSVVVASRHLLSGLEHMPAVSTHVLYITASQNEEFLLVSKVPLVSKRCQKELQVVSSFKVSWVVKRTAIS